MSAALSLQQESAAVVRLILRRPEHRNSLNQAILRDFHRLLDQAEARPECRLVVLEGEGEVFCSGMDFEEAAVSSAVPSGADGGELFLSLLKRFTETPRVVVAKVQGRVTGGGVGLVAASDFVFASEHSQFGLPEALWGLLPCCVLPFLIRRVGFQKAYTMTLSTHSISAREACECRLVDELCDDPDTAVRKLAFRLNRIDPQTLVALKRHFGKLWSLSPEAEETALTELSRLMASRLVRHNLTEYVTRRRFPWES
jgi:polyketide biosynthesis enoyl-CoA hydratase PksH